MKRSITLIVLLAMLLSLLVSCEGGNEEDRPTADSTSADDEVSTSSESETDTTKYLEDKDLGGFVFRYLTFSENAGITYDAEALDDNSIADQARIKRDSEVKDRFNVSFEDVVSSDGMITNYVVKDAMLTESSFDLGRLQGSENAAAVIANNAAYDVNKMPYMDTSKPWYCKQANDEYSIMGAQFFFAGMFPTLPGTSHFMFNKDMITQLGLEIPYDIMFEGKWTMERFKEYVSAGYVDMDGVTGASDGDIFGYAGHTRSLPYFFWGFGESNAGRDENGAVVPVLSNDKMDKVYDSLIEFKNMQSVTMNSNLDKENKNSSHRIFFDGRAMFCYWITAGILPWDIETFEYGYGILPKYDESQEDYYSPASGAAVLIACNIAEPDKAGLVVEALCEASYRTTYPATIQEAIKYERFCDEESIEMKKFVDSYLAIDILAIFDPSGGQLANCMFMNTCLESNTAPSVMAAGAQEAIEKMYHDFFYSQD